MQKLSFLRRVCARGIAAAGVLLTTVSCGIEKQAAPALAGPSEFGESITMVADPDILQRDGASQSRITLFFRGPNNENLANRPLTLSLNPNTGGTLSETQVTTDGSGRAIFYLTAPSADTILDRVTVGATPVGTNAGNAAMRSISVALSGPAAATPSFTVSPTNPARFQATVLDASGTTYNGGPCNSACTYQWRIGSEATPTGQVVTHSFQQQTSYVVILEVTAPTGVTTRTQQVVPVGAGVAPTAAFTLSPTNPNVGQTVIFNGSTSRGANGATIVSYEWEFGNGNTATGPIATTTFTTENTFVVTLTVTDSNGQKATVTQQVSATVP
jgi:PKD repeat protein